MRILLAIALVTVSLAGCAQPVPEPGESIESPVSDPNDAFARLDDFSDPVHVTHAGDGSGRLFVIEQRGTVIEVSPDGERTVFADLRHFTKAGFERGLLGWAFHPDFASNGVMFASFTDVRGDSILARFSLGDDGLLDVQSSEFLLTVKQPYANHNGGHILFGPDGYLYMGLGDGGSAGDPDDNGQSPYKKLGSILRMGVGATGDYTIPEDNPFADGRFGAPEVWAYGLRNPWRFSFDDEGNLWIGDVGQGAREEINRMAPDEGGANFGWNHWEGTMKYPSGAEYDPEFDEEDAEDMTFPVAQYSHGDAHCSVTGGVPIGDRYYFGDYCSGTIWSMPLDGELGSATIHDDTDYEIVSFGRDEAGNVYLVSLDGTVERFSP